MKMKLCLILAIALIVAVIIACIVFHSLSML